MWKERYPGGGAYLGIDTVAVCGEIRDIDASDLYSLDSSRYVDWSTGAAKLDRTIFRLPSGGRLTLRSRRGLMTASIEASPSKLLRGSNFHPSTAAEVRAVMSHLYAEVGERGRWATRFGDMRLTRVDATGHIREVSQRDRLLRALATLPVPRNPPTALRHDRARGGALTLSRGPGRHWKLVAYDKEAEVAHRAARSRGATRAAAMRDLRHARGVLRVEVVHRTPVLRRLAVVTVGDLSDQVFAQQHRRRFDQVGLGLEIGGLMTAVRVAHEASNLTPQQRVMAMGVLLFDLAGVDTGLKPEIVSKHRRRARALGLAPEALDSAGPPVRLDYDTARQVEVQR